MMFQYGFAVLCCIVMPCVFGSTNGKRAFGIIAMTTLFWLAYNS